MIEDRNSVNTPQNVVPLRNREQIREQAGVWLIRLQEGLSAEQKNNLAEWLGENSAHRYALLELATLWDDMAVLKELSELFLLAPKTPGPWRPRLISHIGLAATILMATLVGAWLAIGSLGSGNSPVNSLPKRVSTPYAEYTTAIGEQSTIKLADGSVIILNTNTRLSVQYTDTERKIQLTRGEGHFQVAKDPSRPFVVTAGTNAVRAVGTAFSVMMSDSEDLEVVVTEGTVAIFSTVRSNKKWELATTSSREETTAIAGEMVIIQKSDSQVRRLDEDNIAKRLAWHNGMVVFEDENLDAVIEELGRYTTIELALDDDSLSDIRVAGYFRTGDMEALLFALRENFHIGSRKEGANTIVLYRL